jgi:hypothetical protein
MNSGATTIDEYLKDLPEWQVEKLQTFRKLVHQADPDITEDIKWGVPVFVHESKVLFTMASFKDHTKYNFILNGALLEDSGHLFNNGLESKKSRSIDLSDKQSIDVMDLMKLIQAAVQKL